MFLCPPLCGLFSFIVPTKVGISYYIKKGTHQKRSLNSYSVLGLQLKHLEALTSPHKQPSQKHLFCYIYMYRALTYPKLFCRLPHSRMIFNNIPRQPRRPFFNIIFQGKIPRTHCFYNVCGGNNDYVRAFPAEIISYSCILS